MRLSTRSRYGVRLMVALAVNGAREPMFLKDIARMEEISEKYLGQIIIPLKAHGLVRTFRGAHGGYLLGRPAADITIRDIVEPLEGDLRLVECVSDSSACDRSSRCVTRGLWDGLSMRMREYLESITLEEIASAHAARAPGTADDFSI